MFFPCNEVKFISCFKWKGQPEFSDQTFIVFNIKGLHHQVAKILGLENYEKCLVPLWKRYLKSFPGNSLSRFKLQFILKQSKNYKFKPYPKIARLDISSVQILKRK